MVGLDEMEAPSIPFLVAEALRDEAVKSLPPSVFVTVSPSTDASASVHFVRAGSGRMGENTASFRVDVFPEEYRIVTNPLDGEDDQHIPYEEGFLEEASQSVMALVKRLVMDR